MILFYLVFILSDVQFINLKFTMKEKRIGEWGSNVTRLLFYLEDFNENIVDSYEYKAPLDEIYVRKRLFMKCF